MRAGLGMDGDVIAAGLGERLEIGIAGRDHQMRVEDLLGVRAHRLDDVGAVGNVRHEMPVHHVEMDPVGAGRIDGADFLAQLGEIRRQDRRRDDEGTRRKLLGHVRFPKALRGAERLRVTCRTAGGNAAADVSCGRKNLPERAAIAGLRGSGSDARKPWFYWVFLHGTALAERTAYELSAAAARPCWSSAMLLCSGRCVIGDRCPQGADVVEVVVAQTTGVSQDAASPFDLSSSSSLGFDRLGRGLGGGGGSQISPETMSALLDAQSQSSTGSTTTASKSRSDALKDLFAQIDGDGDGKITKSEFENALGAGGTNLAQADERVRQARQGWRRLGQPRRDWRRR